MPSALPTFTKRFLSVACFVLFLGTAAFAQASIITYQGRLADGLSVKKKILAMSYVP